MPLFDSSAFNQLIVVWKLLKMRAFASDCSVRSSRSSSISTFSFEASTTRPPFAMLALSSALRTSAGRLLPLGTFTSSDASSSTSCLRFLLLLLELLLDLPLRLPLPLLELFFFVAEEDDLLFCFLAGRSPQATQLEVEETLSNLQRGHVQALLPPPLLEPLLTDETMLREKFGGSLYWTKCFRDLILKLQVGL